MGTVVFYQNSADIMDNYWLIQTLGKWNFFINTEKMVSNSSQIKENVLVIILVCHLRA